MEKNQTREQKRRNKRTIIGKAIVTTIAAILASFLLARGCDIFSPRFTVGTKINGRNMSLCTVQMAVRQLERAEAFYLLIVTEEEATAYRISGEEANKMINGFAIQRRNLAEELQKIMELQQRNSNEWEFDVMLYYSTNGGAIMEFVQQIPIPEIQGDPEKEEYVARQIQGQLSSGRIETLLINLEKIKE